jgi:hypothetical protein
MRQPAGVASGVCTAIQFAILFQHIFPEIGMSQEPQVVSMMHAIRHAKPSAESRDYYQKLLQTLSVPGVTPENNTAQGKAAREALMLWNGYYTLSASGRMPQRNRWRRVLSSRLMPTWW